MLSSAPRIGLFGGSFDPPHVAHIALARTALQHLRLDELHWIPAGQPWQKARRLASGTHRAAMVQAAACGEPRFVLDRSELDRPGPSYTIDTVRALQAGRPEAEWFLVIGADQYARLSSWRQWQELLLRVTLAVAGRDTAPPTLPPHDVSALPHRMERLPMAPIDASSTAIRAHLAAGRPAAELEPTILTAEVARYIDRHGLYRPPPTPEPARS